MKNIYLLSLFLLANLVLQAACPVTITAGGPTSFCTGDSVLLSASSGTGYTYQWRRNGLNISGATAQTYYAKTTGNYAVFVSVASPACTQLSNSISVTAQTPLSVSVSDAGPSMCTASTDILQAVPGGGGSLLYQWFEDNTLLPGITGAQMETGHDGTYSCAVTNGCGTYTSPGYVLNYYGNSGFPETGVISANGSTTICTGGSVLLYQTDQNWFQYQWYRNGVAISGATSNSYTASVPGDYLLQMTYQCWINFQMVTFCSNVITVTQVSQLFPVAGITAAGPTTFCAGGSVTLNVTSTDPSWSYQWKLNSVNIAGATGTSYVATAAGGYTCQVYSSCGSATSGNISVQLTPTSVAVTPGNNVNVCTGSTILLAAGSAGTGGTYQWKLNGTDIPGATGSLYSASPGTYTCVITNSCGSFTSNAVTVTAVSCATGLQFDGGNDYVRMPNNAATNFGSNNFTIEAWVSLDPTQPASGPMLLADYGPSTGMYMQFINGKIRVYMSGNNIQMGGPDMRDNQCHHHALTRSGPTTINYYIDGTLIQTATISNVNVTSSTAWFIGNYSSPNPAYALKGKMMEVRMWNVARTQTEIQNARNNVLAGTEPGLVGYWRFDDGGGQVANDYSLTNNDGQLGSTVNIDTNDPLFAASCPLGGCPVVNAVITAAGSTYICGGTTVTLSTSVVAGMTYQWLFNNVNIPGATASTYAASAVGSYTCRVSNGCGNFGVSNAIAVTNDITCYSGLQFDGVSDVVTIPQHAAYNLGGSFTIEAWIRDDASQNSPTNEPIISNWSSANLNGIRFYVSDGRLSMGPGGGIGPELRDGNCHRISITHSGTSGQYSFYVDGIFIYRNPTGANLSSTLPLLIGASINASGGMDYFRGFIKEVRVWNIANVQSDMNRPLDIATATGLVGNWRFNEASGQTVNDLSNTNNDGVLGLTNGPENEDPSWSAGCPYCPLASATISAGGPTTLCFGSTVTLNASPTGAGYSYQWRRNGIKLPNATSASYTVNTAGIYDVIISDGTCQSASNAISVTVNGGQTTLVLQPNGATGTDAMVSNFTTGNANIIGGNGPDLDADAWVQYRSDAQRSFLRFDLSSLPTNTKIQQAVLTLFNSPTAALPATGGPTDALPGNHYHNNANTNACWLQQVIAPWTESTVTWATQPATTIFNQVVLPQDTNPHQDYFLDVTQSVQEFIANPATNYGWKLRLQSEGYWTSMLFASSDNADSTKWPRLTITYYDSVPTIKAQGPTSICAGSSVTMTVSPSAGVTLQWKLNGSDIPGATSAVYAATLSGNYTCLVTSPCSSVLSNTLSVSFASIPPTASITAGGSTTICSGNTVALNANTGAGLTYQWKLNTVNITNATSSSYAANAAGSYTCELTNSCGSTVSNALSVVVNTAPSATITAGGNTTFCTGGSVTLNANTGTGLTYQWKLNTNTIAGATAASYNAASAGTYTCVVTNSCGSTSSNGIAVTVNTTPPASISAGGSTTFCTGGSVTFNANTGTGLTYQWKLNTVDINGATASSYVASAAGTYSCVVTNTCGSATSNSLAVTVNSLPPGVITASGNTTFCAGGTVTLNASTGTGYSFQWQLNGGNIPSATGSFYTATAGGNYTCNITNSCGTVGSNSITVTVNPLPSASITAGGSTTFCTGGSVTLNANTGTGLTYQWRLNTVNINGATASSYAASAAGSYTCVVTNSCGNTTSNSISVTVNTPPVANATPLGSTNFCTGGSVTISATTGTGFSWQWRLNTVNITGATASTYVATAAGTYTCVITNSCGSSTSNGVVVTVNAPPTASITAGGNTTFCSGGSVQLNANTGTGLTYQWQRNGTNLSGATTNSYTASAAGNYTCIVTNACTSATSNAITVTVQTTPATPGTISGQVSGICGTTTTYTVGAISGASTYTWTLPTGTVINSGQGTTSLNVTYPIPFSSGNIAVTAGNTCGTSSASTRSVSATLAPTGPMTGNASVCDMSRAIYSVPAVPGATNYTWTIPPKAKIMAGQGTPTIDVRFHQFGGNITVTVSNACTTSAPLVFPVTIVNCTHNPHRSLALDANVYPNPASAAFTLKVISVSDAACTLYVTDMTGRNVERLDNITPGDEVQFGKNLAPGVYLAEIRQGEERMVLRVVRSR